MKTYDSIQHNITDAETAQIVPASINLDKHGLTVTIEGYETIVIDLSGVPSIYRGDDAVFVCKIKKEEK